MRSKNLFALISVAVTSCLITIPVAIRSGAQNPSQDSAAAKPSAQTADKSNFETYHRGPWEQTIGYSQAVRSGHMLYVSGTTGANAKGEPQDLDGQMKNAYAGLQTTLEHYHTGFSHVIKERIYTTDMDALIRSQETRKQIYGTSLPAATWVQVSRLYSPAAKIEIELDVSLD